MADTSAKSPRERINTSSEASAFAKCYEIKEPRAVVKANASKFWASAITEARAGPNDKGTGKRKTSYQELALK